MYNLFISGQRLSVDTVSAAVQTNSEASPPPYAVLDLYQCPCTLMEDGVVFEMHIPRCPSYVKDPPNYLDAIHSDEVTVTVQNETEENDTAIEFSVDSSAVAWYLPEKSCQYFFDNYIFFNLIIFFQCLSDTIFYWPHVYYFWYCCLFFPPWKC